MASITSCSVIFKHLQTYRSEQLPTALQPWHWPIQPGSWFAS